MHSPIRIPSSGPSPAKVLVVGDAASADDEWKMAPFSGGLGNELTKMLHEAKILQSECRMTLVLPYRPSKGQVTNHFTKVKKLAGELGLGHFKNGYYYDDAIDIHLQQLQLEIERVQPTVIIALGELALWALTGEQGLTSWRGSLLDCSLQPGICTIPTYHPSSIMRSWDWRAIAVRDLQRASAYLETPAAYAVPQYQFSIRPSIGTVLGTIDWLFGECSKGELRVAVDIETIARNVSCIGLGWSRLDAICIPMLDKGGVDYWSLDEEIAVYAALKKLLTLPNCYVVGQNFAYDRQHFAKSFGYQPNLRSDSMIAQHLLYPGSPKALDFIASMYCHYYRYWKDELKDFNRMPDDIHEYWTYNCKDCVITWETSIVLEELVERAGMQPQYAFQMAMLEHVNKTMLRGVRIDAKRRSTVAGELMEAIRIREELIQTLVGFPLNVGSPVQMARYLYEELGIAPVINRKTKRPTCDDEALKTIARRQPLLKPLLDVIAEKRSLGVFLSTFCLMPLDTDGRMRTSYNIAGTETFRFNSSENAFGSGGNLQNIPKGEEE